MEKPTHMYDVLGKRNKTGVVKAMIAARFENAAQTFNKLCSKSTTFAQLLPDTKSQSQQLEDVFARFLTWGHETGASDQTLDHRLRTSRDLRETVLEALQQLQSSLDDGVQLVEDERVQEWSNQLVEQKETTASVFVFEEDEENNRHNLGALQPATAAANHSDDEHEDDDNDNEDKTAALSEIVWDVFDVIKQAVNDVVALGPSLDHPYPEDLDSYPSSLLSTGSGSLLSDRGDQMDIERAKLEFPAASSILQTRLGRANWRRRIAQLVVQQQILQDGRIRLPRHDRSRTNSSSSSSQPHQHQHHHQHHQNQHRSLHHVQHGHDALHGSGGGAAGSGNKRTARHQDVAQDAFNFSKPTLNSIGPGPAGATTAANQARPGFLPLLSAAASSITALSDSDTASVFDSEAPASRLARNESVTTLATMSHYGSKLGSGVSSLTAGQAALARAGGGGGGVSQTAGQSGAAQQQPVLSLPLQLPPPPTRESLFPKPPLPLTDVAALRAKPQAFTCNLCGYDLDAGGRIQSEGDWQQHVLEDLAPYLCTFDRCFSAQETYAQMDEWYRHELESHRIPRTWSCPACSLEFATKQAALDHIASHGSQDNDSGGDDDDDDDDERRLLRSMLRQPTLSSTAQLGVQSCPLCRAKVAASACKEHIASHLEYFALLSLADDDADDADCEDSSDDMYSQAGGGGDGASTTSSDALSERGRKERVLNTFVAEQFKLNTERGRLAPECLPDHVSGEAGSRSQPVADHMGQNTDRADRAGRADDRADRAGRTDRAEGQPAPASLASSADRLPLLRTGSFPRSADFLGRDRELANLYKILSEPGKVCVVSGEGGMGKTALAVEYAWRFAHSYHYIFWVQAETPVGSSDTFCQIAVQLQLAPDGADPDTLVRLGREFLEQVQDRRWLMVLDNVDRWEDIDSYTPSKTSATQGSILITTRHDSFTAPSRPFNYFRIALQDLSVDDGRKLLIHGLPDSLRPHELSLRDPEYKVAGEIAALAGLPLLIVYISGYIKKFGCTPSEFWEYWNEWRPKARLAGGGPGGPGGSGGSSGSSGGPPASQRDTIGRDSVFYMALQDLSADETKVLKIMAFFDSDGIQRELLEWTDTADPGPSYLRKGRLRFIITTLKGQKIVTAKKQGDREVYSVHRLLQARLLQDMNANRGERDEIFGIAFALIRRRLPRPSLDTPEPSTWNAFKEYLPHVLSLQRAYADPLSIVTVRPFVGLAELFKDGGVLLWQRYIHGDALRLLKSAEKVLNQLPLDEKDEEGGDDEERDEKDEKKKKDEMSTNKTGNQHDKHADLRCEINITINLLLQYFGINYRKEIMERSGHILAYRRQSMARNPAPSPEDRLVVCHAEADYANTLLQFNDFEAAEPIYAACLDTYTQLGHGPAAAAAAALRPGLRPGRHGSRDADSSTAFAIAKLHHHLAYCKMYRHDFGAALALGEQAVRIIEAVVGDRAIALRYRFDLACIVLQAGQPEQALDMHKDILKARLGFQGRASYFTLQSQYAVAALYHGLGKLAEAESLMTSALAKAAARGAKNFWPDAAVARTKYHLSLVLAERASREPGPDEAAADADADTGAPDDADAPDRRRQRRADAKQLAIAAKDVLSRMLPYDPGPITGVREEDTLALFDHLQPVFGGRFTSTKLLPYVCEAAVRRRKGATPAKVDGASAAQGKQIHEPGTKAVEIQRG